MSLKTFIKKAIIDILPNSLRLNISRKMLPEGSKIAYSQEGEDMILERFFEEKNKGFFIDIGAHHPIRFSNTYHFYLKGWRGINIDATPGSMKPFNKLRPADINIEAGISNKEGELNYYMFYEPALNTFSKERVDFLLNNTSYKLEKTTLVKTVSLKQIFKENLHEGQQIDFLTIDIEGLDYDILLSNDWNKYRPYILLIEAWDISLDNFTDSKFYRFLHPLGYELVAKSFNTVFFRDSFKINS